jgi:phytoene desaturase
MGKRVIVIGSGFAGLSAACYLAHKDYEVIILEKNSQPGGRARVWYKDGFTFDMGPSWYWMTDIFEDFFAYFGCKPSDFYDLVRLDPVYSAIFNGKERMDIPAVTESLYKIFESIEPGSSAQLRQFMMQTTYQYQRGVRGYLSRPSRQPSEFLSFYDPRLILAKSRLRVSQTMSQQARSLFQDERLIRLLEFPALFSGGSAEEIPALYSLINYAILRQGVWYPLGGMQQVVEALITIATTLDVDIQTETEVTRICVSSDGRSVIGVQTPMGFLAADYVIGAGDYHHTEQQLLPPESRTYNTSYWESRTLSPSALLFYLGLNKKTQELHHHNIFFESQQNLAPFFFLTVPSQTDPSVAPPCGENIVIQVPLPATDKCNAVGLEDIYFEQIMTCLERFTGQALRESIVVKRVYTHRDFQGDYHAYQGNVSGLASTEGQTAHLRPRLRSAKLSNLYFTGHHTVPGPGVPFALLSGKMVAQQIMA